MILLCLFFMLLSTSVHTNDSRKSSLRLVNAIFRHGQKTPVNTYPNDPYSGFDFNPYGLGQLTNKGKRAQYKQGLYLRKRYNDFLGPKFKKGMIWVQTTDVDRAKSSALLEISGLFPTNRRRANSAQLSVPLHFDPLDEDKLLLVRIPCPRYYEALDEVQMSPQVRRYTDGLVGLYKYLSDNSGLSIANPHDVLDIYSTMISEAQMNLALPTWTHTVYPEPMQTVTAASFVLNTFTDELKKLKGGLLLKRLLSDSMAKASGTLRPKRRKMFLYAGHDSTVANIMQALKVWDEQVPAYNIMALIELHEIDGVYGWKIFLRNSTEHEPYLLKIPGCSEFCPLDDVKELTKNIIPHDFKQECRSKNPKYIAPPAAGP